MDSGQEIPVKVWNGSILGWRDRTIAIHKTTYTIKRVKEKNVFIKHNSMDYPLKNALIKKVNPDPLVIEIENTIESQGIKFLNDADKRNVCQKLEEIVKSLSTETAFSSKYKTKEIGLEKSSQSSKTPMEGIKLHMVLIQEIVCEMKRKIEEYKRLLDETKIKHKKDKFIEISHSLECMNDEISKKLDGLMVKVSDYDNGKDINHSITNNTEILIDLNNAPIMDDSCSFEEVLKRKMTEYGHIDEDSDNEIITTKMLFDPITDPKHYSNTVYKNLSRSSIPLVIKSSKNMVGELMKSFSTKKGSLPIYFNEPISMLQKQCEKFCYSDLLTKAAEASTPEMRLCYISAFIIAEITFNSNRVLKPFNPILGETFEFYDNEKNFRYFSEQVSHLPPITAFIGEGSDFVMFGDTRASTSFKILKGALEIEFGNKIHLLFKKTNEYYVFNKPLMLMKGLVTPPIRSDYSGTITITNVNNPTTQATLTFLEETKKVPIGGFEGKITTGEKIVYTLKGNWNSNIYYTDPDGSNKVELFHVQDEPFLHNTTESYVLPKYTLSLNTINPDLAATLPNCDSRLRPDMREYENGNIEHAQEIKTKIETKQTDRHVSFEQNKEQYIPKYFMNENKAESGDCIYCYQGGYWESKKSKKNKEKTYDIFEI